MLNQRIPGQLWIHDLQIVRVFIVILVSDCD